MLKKLTQAQVEAYHRDGFVFPIDVMSASEANNLRSRLEDIEHNHPDEINPTNRNNSHLSFMCVDEIVHHSGLLDAVEDIIGPNILAWGSVLFIKDPDAKSFVSWHQDLTYMPMEPPDGVTAWLALTTSNPRTGCMQMIPGSHRHGIREHIDHYGENNLLTRGQTVNEVDTDHAVDIVLAPGQISLHHGHTIHSSSPNRSGERRIGIALQQYLPTHVRQPTINGFAQLARGADKYRNFELLDRPTHDMESEAAEARHRNNEAWANLLYDGADKRRAY